MSTQVPPGPQRTVLKHDTLGAIVLERDGPGARILREPGQAVWGLRTVSGWIAANERRALARLQGLDGVPAVEAGHGRRGHARSFIPGREMRDGGITDPAYFVQARRLLAALHRRGVAHNDLAKEANWLVDDAGRPALVDFQMAWVSPRRSRFFRLLCREDLRHLLKHKRMYFPERLTPVEKRLLKRRSWVRELWFRTGKPVYRFLTRRVLKWEDNEGRGHAPPSRSNKDH